MKRKVKLLITIGLSIAVISGCAQPTPTPTPVPPPPTDTPVVLAPTNTPVPPPPTRTPRPTNTPAPTDTPVPPTEVPTETPVPPTAATEEEDAEAAPSPTEVPTEEPTATTPPTDTPEPATAIAEDMVEVPGGTFIMGSDSGEKNEAPQHEVDLPTFYIDRFEVNNEQFAAFVEVTGYQTLLEQQGSNKTWRSYAEGKELHPVVKVAWEDAIAYCEWASKRLPTEEEWEKAARGTDGRMYPWGNEWDPSRCNAKESGLRGTVAGGSFGSGVSSYGVEDMSGNVWEWTSSPFQAYPGSTYEDPFYSPEHKVTRGGGWFDDKAQLRAANRSAATTSTANDDLGFRCVKDAN